VADFRKYAHAHLTSPGEPADRAEPADATELADRAKPADAAP
jgi:hypothetical protein